MGSVRLLVLFVYHLVELQFYQGRSLIGLQGKLNGLFLNRAVFREVSRVLGFPQGSYFVHLLFARLRKKTKWAVVTQGRSYGGAQGSRYLSQPLLLRLLFCSLFVG